MSLNISPYLFGFGNKSKANGTSTGTRGATGAQSGTMNLFQTFSPFKANTNGRAYGTDSGQWIESIKRIFTYLFAIVIVIAILLLFIHFFVRPVFKWKPSSPGWIPIPGWDDGALFWTKGNTGQIPNTELPIQNQYMDYTLQLDLFIQNPLQFANHPRLILTRGGVKKSPPSGDALLGILKQYNLAIALKPDTNDMIISVLNMNNQMETTILPNIPIQEPFRLTVVVMERAMEVYMNGHLIRTTTFQVPPIDVKGDIFPASGIEANIVRYRNLKIWPRVLTTPEIRSSSPTLSTSKEMDGGPIPTSSTTCGSS